MIPAGKGFLGDGLDSVRNLNRLVFPVKRIKEQLFFLFVDQDPVLIPENRMGRRNRECGEGYTAGENVAADLGKLIGQTDGRQRFACGEGVVSNRCERSRKGD